MTTTSSPVPKANDICGVCAETRENHGDKQHEFSIDGVLKKLSPAPQAKSTPPAERGSAPAQQLSNDPIARLQVRLIERLVAKGILEGDDLIYIFGGGNVSH